MNISLIGYVDNRPLLYSLVKLLQTFGDTLVVSDNTNLRRLTEDFSEYGTLQNTVVAITSDPDTVFDDIDRPRTDFDFIIYDVKEYIPQHVDFAYICLSGNPLEVDPNIGEYFETNHIKYKEISLLYGKRVKARDYMVSLKNAGEFNESVEAYHIIPAAPTELIKVLSKDFSEILVTTPNTIAGVLKKGWSY